MTFVLNLYKCTNWIRYYSTKGRFHDGKTLHDFMDQNDDNLNDSIISNMETTGDSTLSNKANYINLPPWLKTGIPLGGKYFDIKKQLKNLGLATVCQEAKCPNIDECWGGKKGDVSTATIMIMGDTCTRGCRFCSVKTSRNPKPLDINEPFKTAEAISSWNVDYIVITSVDRDDIPDYGASHFCQTVRQIKIKKPEIMIECLTPDFSGKVELIKMVVESGMDVFAHNIESVERLQKLARDPRANYKQSMFVLETAKCIKPNIVTKSSIMVGLGETIDEVVQTMKDLRNVGVDCLTIGQYMRPTKRHLKVYNYVHPDVFDFWKLKGDELGFKYTASGPLVRSSYRAGEFYIKNILNNENYSETVSIPI